MARKKKWRTAACLSCIGLTVAVSACSSGKSYPVGNAEIWSTYNTTKIMREKYDYIKFDARIDVEMAKSEVEGAQIVFTPDYDVRSYDLILSDLRCGEAVFPAEDITAYKQGYVNVTSKTPNQQNTAYPVGWTADFLLPLEKAKEYGETTVQTGYNQGITVEFSSSPDTVPGTYTGNFILVIDGRRTDIPVSVTVWDIDISEVYGKSCFGYSYSNDFMQGRIEQHRGNGGGVLRVFAGQSDFSRRFSPRPGSAAGGVCGDVQKILPTPVFFQLRISRPPRVEQIYGKRRKPVSVCKADRAPLHAGGQLDGNGVLLSRADRRTAYAGRF